MRHISLALILFATTFFTNAQSNKIEIGTIDNIYSKILNENRDVWVYVPDNAMNSDTKMSYPVLYLLDGDWHFYSVVGMIHQLSYINANTICPEMIVVGITNPDRFRDLTPSCDSTINPASGGNEKFISYIEKELIPYIDSTYPTEPYRMLVGHSLGGLTVINTMINHTDMFNSYVAIDPSMWWKNQRTLKETEKALAERRFDDVSLFLAISNSMEKDMDTIRVKKDLTKNTRLIRSILELDKHLKYNKQNGLNFQSVFYNNEDHVSVPHIATYDALHFIFDYYDLPLTKKDFADTSMALAYRIENHYKNISEKMGYVVKPSENLINTLANNAWIMNNFTQAEYFFNLNISYYPESFNVYDSYGDFCAAFDDKEHAVNMYMKALLIKDNTDTKEKLELIRGKK